MSLQAGSVKASNKYLQAGSVAGGVKARTIGVSMGFTLKLQLEE